MTQEGQGNRVAPERTMKLRLQHLLAIAVCPLILSSCGMFGEEKPEYYGVPESQPLELPEELDKPTSQSALTIEYPPVPLPEGEIEAVPPRILANQSGEDGNSKLRWSSDGVYILVEDSSDSVHRRLGYVIERSGMEMRERGSDGNYRFEYHQPRRDNDQGFFSKVAFWREDAPDYSGAYQTLSEPDGDNTRVYLRYADGGDVPMDAAEHVLAILKERLG